MLTYLGSKSWTAENVPSTKIGEFYAAAACSSKYASTKIMIGGRCCGCCKLPWWHSNFQNWSLHWLIALTSRSADDSAPIIEPLVVP